MTAFAARIVNTRKLMFTRIDVHSTVSFNSIRYYDYMRANYRALADVPARVRFIAYCLDRPSAFWLSRFAGLAGVVAIPYARGSLGHALGIEAALQRSEPGAVHVIADADTVIFARGWDSMIVEALAESRRYGILGAPYEDIGGFSSGVTPHQTYKRIPTMTWMAMSPHFDFRNLEARPDKGTAIELDTEELAQIYNLPVGFSVLKDVGWQLPGFIHRHGLPHLAFDLVSPESPLAKPLAGVAPYHDEFHWEGRPFLAHQRGSMKHRFRIDPLSCDFYDACDRYLGEPAWSIKPNAFNHAVAKAQNVARRVKRAGIAVLRR